MKKKNYVNNADMWQALVDYKKDVEKAEKEGNPKPKIPDYLANCFEQMATRYATTPRWNRFTYVDEMIRDGVFLCVKYIDRFNTKYKNPFAYFTQILFNAYKARNVKEMKQTYVNVKSMEGQPLFDEVISSSPKANAEHKEFMEVMSPTMDYFEEKKGNKEAVKKNFMNLNKSTRKKKTTATPEKAVKKEKVAIKKATKKTAKKSPVKKATAKKSPAKKAVKKAIAKKPVKKAPVKKTTAKATAKAAMSSVKKASKKTSVKKK